MAEAISEKFVLPEWCKDSLYRDEIAALGDAGRKFLIDLDNQCGNAEALVALTIATARMADRIALINAGLTAGGIGRSDRPSKLLAELARVEKLFLANLRGLGYCDKDEDPNKGTDAYGELPKQV